MARIPMRRAVGAHVTGLAPTAARRRTGARIPALLALLLSGATGIAPAARATDLAFTGYARDLETRRLLYIESHFVRDAGRPGETRVVMYRCANGTETFARKQLRYGEVREEPEFTFVDGRSGYTEGLRRTPRGSQVFQRDDARSALRESVVPTNVVIVADAGFDEFVRRHWSEIEAGRTVRFPFLVPSRLDFLTFKVRKQQDETIEGVPASVIRLNLSGVLGWFLPYIEVSYRKADQVLMRYKGLTNVRDGGGNNLVAQIDFPAKERRTLPAGGAPLEAQQAASLVARCSGG